MSRPEVGRRDGNEQITEPEGEGQSEEEDWRNQTGWERIKSLFIFDPMSDDGEPVPEELKTFAATVLVATFSGFLFGGLIGARHAGDKFILMHHGSKFTSSMQAQRELHSAALLGFVSKGSKWAWKTGMFAGIFSGTHTTLSVYRDKEDALNYVAAGAVTGGLFRVRAGLKPTIGGAVLGTLLSLPVGIFMQGLDWLLVGKEERERMRREKYEASRRRAREWQRKLDSTSALIQDLEVGLHSSSPSEGGLQSYYSAGPAGDQQDIDHQNIHSSDSQSDSSHHRTPSSAVRK